MNKISSNLNSDFKLRNPFVIKNVSSKSLVKYAKGNSLDNVDKLFGSKLEYNFGKNLQQKSGNGNDDSIYIPELLMRIKS